MSGGSGRKGLGLLPNAVLWFVVLALLSPGVVFGLSLAVYFALPYVGFPQNPPASAATSGPGWPVLSVQVDSGDDRQLLISIQSWLATLLGFVFAAVGFMLSHRKEQTAVEQEEAAAINRITTDFFLLQTSFSDGPMAKIKDSQEEWASSLASVEKAAKKMEEGLYKSLKLFPKHKDDLDSLIAEMSTIKGFCVPAGAERSDERNSTKRNIQKHIKYCENLWPNTTSDEDG